MAFSVVMPALEMAQETGKLLAWRKKEGDRVSKGEPLLEIETDKAVVEVEAPADGILAAVKAAEGSDIPVGQTIAWIVAPGEVPPAHDDSATPAARTGRQGNTEHTGTVSASTVSSTPAAAVKISPKARRLAKELGVDVARLHGSGPDSEILASDVQAAAVEAPKASPREGTGGLEIPSSVGRIMAERTAQSWTTVPHFFLTRDIDATALNQYRERVVAETEKSHEVRITHTDLLVALTARTLLKHSRLNGSWTPEGIRLHGHVHMGVAIAVSDGVVAVVIRNADTESLAAIATQRHQIIERARARKLRPGDIADATFTISNLGMYQVAQFNAIITPPQAAVLAVGEISDRVVAVEGQPAVRPMMAVTLSCDHRLVDGARAAMFLGDLAAALQEPEKFLGRH
jgi:pyruvate dehydrogenase E2 component (dihydrolipoamide acetyltransferase)